MIANKVKRSVIFVMCIAFAISFLSLEASGKENTLVVGLGMEADDLLLVAANQASLDRVGNIGEPLVNLDSVAKSIPGLATSWEVVDGKKWRFHLRRGVIFHSGEKFTAEDVGFTIDMAKDPKNKCLRRGMVKGYTYNIVDDYTIDIIDETGGLDPILPAVWWPINIVPKDTFTKMGIDKFSRNPIGTGPFQFVEWKEGEHLILTAFDKYWAGKPRIDKIIIKTIPELASRLIGLKTGNLDIIQDINPSELKSVREDPKLEIKTKESLYQMHLQLRCDIPPFKDNINLRKAVAHAIDAEMICKQILGGLGVPAGSITPSSAFGYNKSIKPYKYDPKLAKEYLTKSGYKGETIYMISSTGRYLMDVEINNAVAGYLKAIGIKAEVQLVDWTTWYDKFRTKTMAPIFLLGWADNSGDGVENLFDTAHKDSPYHWLDKDGIPEVNKLVNIARTVQDSKVRREAMEKANQILHDYYYYAMIYTPMKVSGVRKGIKWEPRADEIFRVTYTDEIY